MKRFAPLLALAVAGLLLASCSSDSSSDNASDPYGNSSDTTAADASATTAAGDDVATGGATVAVAEVGELGEALVDAEGFTLYLFTNDDGTTSACADACLDTWPAAVADGEPTAGDGADAALLSTADAAAPDQVVYNGHLLYRFSGDAAPGDANGAEIPNWHAVDADGNAIEAA